MTEKEKMLAGKIYRTDDEIIDDAKRARKLLRAFNQSTEEQIDYRAGLLRALFAKTGEHIYIEPPFQCDFGCNISVGDHFYANFDCVILDVCRVTVGKHVMFGPKVCVFAAGHPISAFAREARLEFGKPVTIGDHVWVGGNTVINPGVNIGSRVVIGSGSVVTKDIPDDTVAVGNPCRVLRKIDHKDDEYWRTLQQEYEMGR